MMALIAYWMVPLPTLTNSLGDVSNVKLWTPVEVSEWVGSQSDPEVAALKDIFIEKDIDGALLLTLTQQNLEELAPEMMEKVAGKRLAALIHKLQIMYLTLSILLFVINAELLGGFEFHRPRAPTDFWEYYDRHPHGTMVMITGIIVAPRTSLLYLQFFDPAILAGVVVSSSSHHF
jgi:hypothetical protein